MGTLLDAVTATEAAYNEARRRADSLENLLRSAQDKAEKGRKRGVRTALIEQHEETARTLKPAVASAKFELSAANEAWRAAGLALEEARKASWERRLAEICATLQLDNGAGDVMLYTRMLGSTHDSGTTQHVVVEVEMLEMDPETGARVMETFKRPSLPYDANRPASEEVYEESFFPKRRFGYHATVYGPERRIKNYIRETDSYEYYWQGAEINWGSMGSRSIQQALDMLRVQTLAIRVAQILEARRDEWYAEDLAD